MHPVPNKFLLIASLLLAGGAGQANAQSAAPFKIIQTFSIKSGGGWDYLAVSPVTNYLYVSHGTQVNILDKTTGDSVGIFPNTTGVHGIAFAPAAGKGFISCGRLNSLTVFDIRTNKVTGTIATGDNPDALFYEPFTKMMVVCNNRGKSLSVIDPVTEKVVHTIDVGGSPEEGVSDERGKVFVNLEDRSEIVEIDMRAAKVAGRWKIAPGEEPTGLAYDKRNNRLFAGCGNRMMVAVNAANGKVVAHLPVGDHCDGIAFDPKAREIFVPGGEGNLTVIRQAGADKYSVIQTLSTKRGARTIAIDESTGRVYLPASDYEAQTAADAAAHTRPRMIPGTFRVLVVGR